MTNKEILKVVNKVLSTFTILEVPKSNYTHKILTDIGYLYFTINTEGSVFSIFGNFMDEPYQAKEIYGHWKYNLHLIKKELNEQSLSLEIIDYFEKVLPKELV